jgi:arsenate reductase-like glutaredoxin family protein
MNSKEIIAEKYKIKRVVVHTGPGKTGSSAIQAWLLKNSHFLEARGVYYPKHDILKNQISSGHLQEILNKNEKGEWKVEPKKIARLLNTFHQSDCHTLLLSSEYFFHKIVEIQKYIPNAEFIAYIRNPVELIESNYKGVKRHTKINRFYPPQALDGYFWHYLEVTFKKLQQIVFY